MSAPPNTPSCGAVQLYGLPFAYYAVMAMQQRVGACDDSCIGHDVLHGVIRSNHWHGKRCAAQFHMHVKCIDEQYIVLQLLYVCLPRPIGYENNGILDVLLCVHTASAVVVDVETVINRVNTLVKSINPSSIECLKTSSSILATRRYCQHRLSIAFLPLSVCTSAQQQVPAGDAWVCTPSTCGTSGSPCDIHATLYKT